MSLRSLSLLWLCALQMRAAQPLRICADPDNLPFSHRSGMGFDNRIAVLVARDLGREPEFVWIRSRVGFTREVFNKGACDVLMGVPAQVERVATTQPYYRSTYVFVAPARERLQISTFSDRRLNGIRIGLQRLQGDYAPPSIPLIRNGHARQLVGFGTFGQREGDVVRAVASGDVKVSVVWGPVAGYYVAREQLPLTITAVAPESAPSTIPLAYSMSMGVHKRDTQLLQRLNASITTPAAEDRCDAA